MSLFAMSLCPSVSPCLCGSTAMAQIKCDGSASSVQIRVHPRSKDAMVRCLRESFVSWRLCACDGAMCDGIYVDQRYPRFLRAMSLCGSVSLGLCGEIPTFHPKDPGRNRSHRIRWRVRGERGPAPLRWREAHRGGRAVAGIRTEVSDGRQGWLRAASEPG